MTVLAALFGGASCELDLTSRLDGHGEVAGVQLLGEDGALLPDGALPPGGPHAVTARFLDLRGRPIDLRAGEHHISLRWEPDGTATSEPSASADFTHDVTVPESCDPPQRVIIGYGHDTRADERVFELPVAVTPQFGAARAFSADGQELTPTVRLPSTVPVRMEVRFYDCFGELVQGLEGEYEALLFFPTVEFADWKSIPENSLQVEVEVNEPSGTEGAISLGIRRISGRGFQAFGPFPLVVE